MPQLSRSRPKAGKGKIEEKLTKIEGAAEDKKKTAVSECVKRKIFIK